MKSMRSALLAAATVAIAVIGIQESYAADILGEAPPAAAPYYARPYSYQSPEYGQPRYEPAPLPPYATYGESRYEPAPVPPAPIYGEPDYGASVYGAPGPQVYEGRVYAAPEPRYAPAQTCYWTRGEPVWDGYAWSRRPVQVCN
jgi:hypothetical protein